MCVFISIQSMQLLELQFFAAFQPKQNYNVPLQSHIILERELNIGEHQYGLIWST